MDSTLKVILDTDIGSDIDDAVCLAYLLAQPRCDLLGITTVSGQVVERAMLASAQCTVAGRDDIPILPGIAQPLLGPQLQPEAPQAATLDRWPHRAEFPENEAIEWMRSTIRANPGEVTLLAVGPLTNVATLFTVDPEIPALLKALVLMAGSIATPAGWEQGSPYAEWNVRCDPHAAAIVYRARPPVFRSVGLDVTLQVHLPVAEARERFTAPLHAPVLDFTQVWSKDGATPMYFHDPLAAAALFEEGIVELRRGRVEVELTSPLIAGATVWTPDPEGPVEFAHSVDAEAFFTEYFSVFSP